jgi:RNA polymerase sigma factor (sigma-70 family)
MASGQLSTVLRHLRQLLGSAPGREGDSQLLHRFVHDNDQAAFTALVERHGAMVLGLCRRVLGNDHDAEDVFQATFLVLVRKARLLRQYGSLANWLYTVAYHLALKTRAQQAKRRAQERQVTAMPEIAAGGASPWSELRPVLDAELECLPSKYRAPVVLCYLEGKSNEEAARELGWPTGTVKIRLFRARALLQARLSKRGLTLATGLLTATLAEQASAAVSIPLLESTIEAAALFAAGNVTAAGAVSVRAVLIAQGALRTMFVNKVKFAAALILLVLGVVGAGTGALWSQVAAEPPNADRGEDPVAAADPAKPMADDAANKKDPIKLVPRSRRVHKRLGQVVSQDAFQPKTKLKDALAFISERYSIPIIVNKRAFDAIGIKAVEEEPVELPKMTDVRLYTVLRILLAQIKGDVYSGTYLVRPDHVEVTTTYNQMAETLTEWPDNPALMMLFEPDVPRELLGDPSRKRTPVVHVDVDSRPLAEALQDLAEQAEIDIVIDRRAREKAKTPVELTVNNAPFDTAIGLLVEQADMDWMWVDNVIYVATKEDVKARHDRKRAREQEKLKMIREAQRGPGQPGNPFSPGGPDPGSTIPTPPPAKPMLQPGGQPPGA